MTQPTPSLRSLDLRPARAVTVALLAGLALATAAMALEPLAVGEHVFHRRQLDNGLLALAAEEPSDDTVSVFVVVGAGGRQESVDTAGLAHLAEHALYTGTATTPAGGHDARVRELGGESNAFTRDDYTLFYDHRVPADALGEVLALEADRLRGLTFERDAVLHERERLAEEERATYTRAMARDAALEAAVFRVHPYGVGLLDDEGNTLAPGLDVATVRAFYDLWYRPDNTAVVVVGGVEPAAALDAVATAFGGLERGPERPAPPAEPPFEARPADARSMRLPSGLSADRVVHVWLGPPMGHPDRPALAVLARWLASQTLVGGTPVDASMGARVDADLFRVAATGEGAGEGLERLLERVRERPLPAVDVDDTQKLLRDDFTSLELRARPYFSLAAEVAIHSVLGHADAPARWADAVDAVTPESVLAAARRHLAPERRVEVVFEGTGEPRPALPDDVGELRELAIDAAESGDYDLSIQAYSRLLELGPDRMNTVIYLASRGQARMAQRDYDAAVRDFEDALAVVDYPAVRDLLAEARRLQAGGLRQEVSDAADDGGGGEGASEPAREEPETETQTETDAEVDIQAELEAQVEELKAELEAWRDLPFLEPVALELDHGADPKLAGWYEPDTQRLVVVPDKTARFRRGTLLHELFHALQDQHFDLSRLRDEAGDDPDAQAALTALIEGEAMFAVSELLNYDFESHAVIEPTGEIPEDRFQKIFHYGAGLRFVRARRDAAGWDGVSELYRRPPRTTAEILHPDLYPRGDVDPLDDVALEGEVAWDVRRGENHLRWLLVRTEATRAAAGKMAALLRADRWRVVEAGDAHNVVWDLRFADEATARRFERYARLTLEDEGWTLEPRGRDLRLTRPAWPEDLEEAGV